MLLTPLARAVDGDFQLSLGYSHLHLDGSQRFEDRDGFRIEPRVSFAFFDKLPQLRLGFGLGISGYTHELDSDTVITINNGNDTDVIFADQWEGVSLLTPEFQLSWRQTFGGEHHWYVEPGVGLGVAFVNYYVADDWWWDDNNDNPNEWDSTAEVRPFIRAGYQGDRWMGGIEGSYLFGGNIDLTDQVNGDLNELYVGGFFGVRW
jgi:hypothetical protein